MARDDKQPVLFETEPGWSEHWGDMPEFVQEDLAPIKQVIVNFDSEKDMQAFAELVGQTITMRTQSIWYPEAEIGHYANKRYAEKETGK